MTKKRFTYDNKQVAILKNGEFWLECAISTACNHSEICNELNALVDENEQLKQQRKELLRLIDNNIEIYENINTNVEFHQGEIQGKLTLLNNLRKVILND